VQEMVEDDLKKKDSRKLLTEEFDISRRETGGGTFGKIICKDGDKDPL